MMPALHVACAIIEHEGKVLAAQRSEKMNLPLKWEFPGGKLEKDETPEQCLIREVREELGVAIVIQQALPLAKHAYENFHVTLYPFVCGLLDDPVMVLHEHRAVVWVEPGRLHELDWAAADLPVICEYLARQGA